MSWYPLFLYPNPASRSPQSNLKNSCQHESYVSQSLLPTIVFTVVSLAQPLPENTSHSIIPLPKKIVHERGYFELNSSTATFM